MSSAKRILRVMLALILAAPFFVCFYYAADFFLGIQKNNQAQEYSSIYLSEELGIDSREYILLHEEDSHGGVFGEGLYFAVLDCSEKTDEINSLTAGWHAFPMPRSLNEVFSTGYIQGFEPLQNGLFEVNDNCRYYFNNRHREAGSPQDTAIFAQSSFNFTLSIYNPGNQTLCLMCFDT